MPHYGNYGCWKELSPRRRWYFHRCQVIRKITAGNHAALFITQLPGDKAEILHPLWKVIKCSNVVIQLIQTGREQNIPLIKEEKELWFCRFSQDAVCEALSFFHSLDYIFIPPFHSWYADSIIIAPISSGITWPEVAGEKYLIKEPASSFSGCWPASETDVQWHHLRILLYCLSLRCCTCSLHPLRHE